MVSASWGSASYCQRSKVFTQTTLGGGFISLYDTVELPPYSPELITPDFFLWGYLKAKFIEILGLIPLIIWKRYLLRSSKHSLRNISRSYDFRGNTCSIGDRSTRSLGLTCLVEEKKILQENLIFCGNFNFTTRNFNLLAFQLLFKNYVLRLFFQHVKSCIFLRHPVHYNIKLLYGFHAPTCTKFDPRINELVAGQIGITIK